MSLDEFNAERQYLKRNILWEFCMEWSQLLGDPEIASNPNFDREMFTGLNIGPPPRPPIQSVSDEEVMGLSGHLPIDKLAVITKNQLHLIKVLAEHESEDKECNWHNVWDKYAWRALSGNPNIDIPFMLRYDDWLWDWATVVRRPDLTLADVKAFTKAFGEGALTSWWRPIRRFIFANDALQIDELAQLDDDLDGIEANKNLRPCHLVKYKRYFETNPIDCGVYGIPIGTIIRHNWQRGYKNTDRLFSNPALTPAMLHRYGDPSRTWIYKKELLANAFTRHPKFRALLERGAVKRDRWLRAVRDELEPRMPWELMLISLRLWDLPIV
jgi:hypothetical protein